MKRTRVFQITVLLLVIVSAVTVGACASILGKAGFS
jgi:hypothetical protein